MKRLKEKREQESNWIGLYFLYFFLLLFFFSSCFHALASTCIYFVCYVNYDSLNDVLTIFSTTTMASSSSFYFICFNIVNSFFIPIKSTVLVQLPDDVIYLDFGVVQLNEIAIRRNKSLFCDL